MLLVARGCCMHVFLVYSVFRLGMKRLQFSDSDEQSASSESEEVSYYNGDLQMPIFSSNRIVLSPVDVIDVLYNVEHSVSPSRICHRQPIGVECHCSFIVHLHLLKSCDDIKCDDVSCWQNNSCNKFQFVHRNGALSSWIKNIQVSQA